MMARMILAIPASSAADSPEGEQEEGRGVQGDQRLQAEGCQCQRLRGHHADREH